MKLFYIFSNSVAATTCCWDEWADWERPLTCGQVCKYRKRALCVAAWNNICNLFSCNNHHTECPWHETQTNFDSCESITCRELIF